MFHQRSIARGLRSASKWGSICRKLRSAAIALIAADTFHPLRNVLPVPPTDAMPCPQEVTTAIHKTARALDNDDNIDNDNVDNAVVLPHANKDSRDLQSSYSIHAGGSLSSCSPSVLQMHAPCEGQEPC